MIDIIKVYRTDILVTILTFMVGVGCGAAITDALNSWDKKGKSNNDGDNK